MITSFGYKNGDAPKRAAKVFDVRHLTHAVDSSDFKRTESEIVQYLRANPGRDIAIGCEHGKHRSRTLANRVATALRTSVYHRDQ